MTTTLESQATLDMPQLYDVLEAMRRGDFSQRLPADLPDRAGMIARALNATLDMLETFKSEHLRIAREIGDEGLLGGTMEVFTTHGAWQEMVDATNRMSTNLTLQLREMNHAAQRWVAGDASQPMSASQIGGEVAQLQSRLNAAAVKNAK